MESIVVDLPFRFRWHNRELNIFQRFQRVDIASSTASGRNYRRNGRKLYSRNTRLYTSECQRRRRSKCSRSQQGIIKSSISNSIKIVVVIIEEESWIYGQWLVVAESPVPSLRQIVVLTTDDVWIITCPFHCN